MTAAGCGGRAMRSPPESCRGLWAPTPSCPSEVEAYVCDRLGLAVEDAASQVVARDRHAELLSAVALTGASLERFAQEIRHLQRTEVSEVQEPFATGQKGSSAMPHKRNPIVCERICGLARLLRAYAQTGLENVALWHERDISHSSVERITLPDSCVLLDYMLERMNWVVTGMLVRPQRMLQNLDASLGLVHSQTVLGALLEKSLSARATPTSWCSATRRWHGTSSAASSSS